MSDAPDREVDVSYFAVLREECGLSRESVSTRAKSVLDLYEELRARHTFSVNPDQLKVVVNEEFCEWSQPLKDGDTVVFVPPVAGG